jgi:DNA-binding CsgD family transcriptional regulator
MDAGLDSAVERHARSYVASTSGASVFVSQSARDLGLAELWRGLTLGEYRIVENSYAGDRCIARLCRTPRPVPLKKKRLETLRRSLIGESQKSIALDLGLAASSVANACSDCLVALGGGERGSRPSVFLVMAAHAALGYSLPMPLVRADGPVSGDELELSCPRPDSVLRERLTLTEYAVIRAYVEGAAHSSIAARFQCASRTIANHLASVFRKLRVSGRPELLSRLIREQWSP